MRRFLITLLLLLVLVIVAVNITYTVGLHSSTADYSDWMQHTLNSSIRLIDIRMPGAHDALSSDIRYGSRLDEDSAAAIQKGWVGRLIKGFSVRQSRTQISDVKTLLERGIRYLDVRLSREPDDGAWYSTHNYFSRPLLDDLHQLADFLRKHPGEVVLFDIQHIYGIDYKDPLIKVDLENLFIKAGLDAFVVTDDGQSLSHLTYGEVTRNKSRSALLVLSKLEQAAPFMWSYQNSIRSAWPDRDSYEGVFHFLNEEQHLIDSGQALTGNQVDCFSGTDSRYAFRVMQGVLTMQLSGKGVLNALTGWSLIHRAQSFNPVLLSQPEFDKWLEAMPIVMTDFSDSADKRFHEQLMERIIHANGSFQ